MNVLITGGAGFIGSHLSRKMIADGHQVAVLDNLSNGRKDNIADLLSSDRFTFHHADIRNEEDISSVFDEIDWVFHLAGVADIVPSIEDPREYFETNVTGTLNVLEAAKKAGVKRFIYAASSSCYGIPDVYPTNESSPIDSKYPYALTKYLGEELVMHWQQLYDMPALSLRLFNVFGPNSRTTGAYGAVFGVFLAQKMNNRPLTVVGDGNQTRDFTYIADVVSAFSMAAESDLVGEVMNVGSGGTYSINELVNLLGGEITYIPKRPGEPDCTYAETTKIQTLLGWQPQVSFEQGVENMLAHINDWKNAPVWTAASIADATGSWFKYLDK
ncbi:MAG: SDR family oxidoreductase [Gammaproteobacteria bacterium]|nr:SDR family oxidoreductase [Gammaproteobacteria bacterium]